MAKHTYVNGRQLVFDGNGAQLWARFMLWVILSVITCGIKYRFVVDFFTTVCTEHLFFSLFLTDKIKSIKCFLLFTL